MVFVFGIDVPLVELIFVLTLVLVLLFVLLIYIIIRQNRLNKRLMVILDKENTELTSLQDITSEEKAEIKLLNTIRAGLDKLLYSSKTSSKERKKILSSNKKQLKKSKKRKSKSIRTPNRAKLRIAGKK